MTDEQPEQLQPSPAPKRRWFLRPFSDPWSGFGTWVGTLLAIGGLWYTIGQNEPRLTYQLSQARARIVVAGQASELRVLHGGSEIETDVTAAQIAFWNAGKKSVETGDVLEPIRLVTEPRVPILEAKWRQVTRGVCALDLDRTKAGQGELQVHFSILEPQDGGELQVIYAGAPDIAIRMDGVVKGQRELAQPSQAIGKAFAWTILACCALIGPVMFVLETRKIGFKKATQLAIGVGVGLLIVAALSAAVGYLWNYVIRFVGPARPPFPF